jgi:hypothetical protein
MIDAYEVGVSLVMDNRILRSIADANAAMGNLTNTIMGANAALKRMNSYTQTLLSSTNDLRKAWEGVATAVNRASSGGGGAGGGNGRSSPLATGGNGLLLIGGPGGGGPTGFTMPGYVNPNQLRIGAGGVPLYGNIPNNMPARAGASSSDYAIASAAAGAAGYGIFGFINSSVHQAAAVDAIQARMRASGFSASQVSAATGEADATRQSIPGSSLLGNLQLIFELKSVFANVGEAMKQMPTIVKQAIVANATGSGVNYDSAFQMARAGELSAALNNSATGKLDPTKFVNFMNSISTVSLMTAGRVGASDYVAMAQNAGPAIMSQLSQQALFSELPALMLGLGGDRAGTALNALASQFKGGKMSQYAARAMHDVGLLPDYMFGKDDKILDKYKYGIGLAQLPPGALPNPALYNSDPISWFNTVVVPAMAKHGITNQNDQENYLYKMMSRTPGIRVSQDMIANMLLINKYIAMMSQTAGQNSYATIAGQNPNLQISALPAALQSFQTAAGNTIMPVAIQTLNNLTSALNQMGAFAKKYPGLSHDIMETAAAVGSLAISLSVISGVIFVAGPLLRVLKTVAAIGLALAGLADGLTEVGVGIAAIGLAIATLQKWFPDLFKQTNHKGMHWQGSNRGGGAWVPDAQSSAPLGSPSNPVHTVVTNPGDIGKAAASGTINHMVRGLAAPSTGSTGFNPRQTPSGSAAIQMPGSN